MNNLMCGMNAGISPPGTGNLYRMVSDDAEGSFEVRLNSLHAAALRLPAVEFGTDILDTKCNSSQMATLLRLGSFDLKSRKN